MKIIKAKTYSEVPKNFTGIIEWLNRDKFWYKEGKLHREDGPAIEELDGTKHWYKEGKRHREDGPAIERASVIKFWYLNGKEFIQIILSDFIVLDYYQGKHGIMWYKLLTKNQIVEYPDIPELIIKE